MRHTPRQAFTLLEVLLAMAITVMLLGALYVAVESQLTHAQASRDMVEQATLARALLTSMSNDISSSVTLADPSRFRNMNNAANSGSSSGSSTSGSSTSGSSSSSSGTSSSSSSSSSTTTGSTTTSSATSVGVANNTASSGILVPTPTPLNSSGTTYYAYPLGLVGDNTTLHLFVTRLPREMIDAARNLDDTQPPVSDTRRISYWLSGDTGSGAGLAKQVSQPITSDDVLNNTPPQVDNEATLLIGPEVKSLNFTYFDGFEWQDTWDSTQAGADGVTPIGPPLAVSIEIGLPPAADPDGPLKKYRHVVWLMATNGANAASITSTGSTIVGTTNGTSSGGGTTSP